MALMKCPDCNQAVSTTARSCIHCGYDFSPGTIIITRYPVLSNVVKLWQRNINIYIDGKYLGYIGGVPFAEKFVRLSFSVPSGRHTLKVKTANTWFDSATLDFTIQNGEELSFGTQLPYMGIKLWNE